MSDDTLGLYIEESREHLANIENDLLEIEAGGDNINVDLVNKVFRAAHSIKGGAGFVGLKTIKELAHKMENVLGMIRSRELSPAPDVINILLLSSDALRSMINNVAQSDQYDVSQHVDALVQIAAGNLAEEDKATVKADVAISLSDGTQLFHVSEYDVVSAMRADKQIYLIEYDLIHDVHRMGRTPLDILRDLQHTGVIIESKVLVDAIGSLADFDLSQKRSFKLPFVVLFSSNQTPEMVSSLIADIDGGFIYILDDTLTLQPVVPEERDIQPAAEVLTAPVAVEQKAEEKAFSDASLRVNVKLLDSLMNLAGELVLGRNQLLQSIAQDDIRAIGVASQRLDLITSEFQETIMLTRMQPVGNVFNKFPRVVRDLAKSLGKEIDIQLEGRDVELDKTIIEAIGDPLTHLVRNSADHGIETPEVRSRAGKDPKGTIVLKAYHEAGQVIIEIVDDGAGIDGARLVAKALERGLITEEQSRLMSEKEKIALIFMPGFSTAEKVSDVSGRGVGMDVVKTNLDSLGGQVDIESEVGRGTRIRIKLPLTLAIIPSQIISMGSQRYAIPQVNLEELVRIPANQVKDRIELVGDAQVVRLRGKLLPLVRLADILGVERHYTDPQTGETQVDRRSRLADRRSRKDSQAMPLRDAEERLSQDRRYHSASAVNLMVVSTGAMQYGLVVDELHDSEEIVIKPLGRHFSNCSGYAGATIMGDGSVALILDVSGLAHLADLVSVEGSERSLQLSAEQQAVNEDEQSLLLFRCGADQQFCVPQALVQRIEKIASSEIELHGDQRVVQYREATLPLFSIDQVANVQPLAESAGHLVVVFVLGGREIGLLATPPVDVITIDVEFDRGTLVQPGIMGSAIIRGVTTQMVDIFAIVEAVHPDWFEKRKIDRGNAPTILYAEDSIFFRNQVKGFIEDAGYQVIEAEDGEVAWDLMQQHAADIAMVVTDIEMPKMNGFELTERIRADERFNALPVIAMTTLAGQDDVQRGKAVGIDDYQIKLDRERLMESIYQRLNA